MSFSVSQIKPIVQKIELKNANLSLGKIAAPNFKIIAESFEDELCANAVSVLNKRLSEITNTSSDEFLGKVEISLKISNAVPKEIKKNENQAYTIEISENKIELVGYGSAGLYYAVNTLLQCVFVENTKVYVPMLSILDYPDMKTRGHFFETRFGSNLMTLDDWKAVVDDLESMKLNQLVVGLYGCWCVQYDNVVSEYVYVKIPKYPLIKSDVIKKYYSPKNKKWVNETVEVPMARDDFFGELVKYGKSKGVEVLPLWNSYGHNTLIPKVYPEVAPKINGEASKLAFCVSNPKTYELMFDIYDHIIDNYLKPNGIESFHIGLDEVREEFAIDPDNLFKIYSPWCECESCKGLTNQERMQKHAVKLISHLKEKGMKNIYLYCDMIAPKRLGMDASEFKKLLLEKDLMDVTVVDWWAYGNEKEKLNIMNSMPEYGFRATFKPWNSYYHWAHTFDATANIFYMTEFANRDNAEGIQSYSGWDKTADRNHQAIADFSWNFKGSGTPDDYKLRYNEREFPTRLEEAKRGFEIYDAVSFSDAFPNNSISRALCHYYPSSYPRLNPTPLYPRNYPGDSVKAIMENPEYTEELKRISTLADEGYQIFTSLAKDSACNTIMARKYAAELRHYRDNTKDFLAFLEMQSLVETSQKGAELSNKLLLIATERRNNRLDLMLEVEEAKEEFLVPSHLRNHTILMQVFDDLVTYLKETEPSDIMLDFTNLSNISSELFWKLR